MIYIVLWLDVMTAIHQMWSGTNFLAKTSKLHLLNIDTPILKGIEISFQL